MTVHVSHLNARAKEGMGKPTAAHINSFLARPRAAATVATLTGVTNPQALLHSTKPAPRAAALDYVLILGGAQYPFVRTCTRPASLASPTAAGRSFKNKRWLDLVRTGQAVVGLILPLPAAEAQLSPYF